MAAFSLFVHDGAFAHPLRDGFFMNAVIARSIATKRSRLLSWLASLRSQ